MWHPRNRLLLALFAAFFPLRTAAAQFSVQPAILTISTADTVANDRIVARNESDREQQFRVILEDFDQLADGGYTFRPPGTDPRSCASRLTAEPASFTLLPHERQEVRVRLTTTARACWTLVMVQHITAESATGIHPGEQIAVKIYSYPPSATKSAEVTRVASVRDSSGTSVVFDIRNTGEAPVRPTGTVEIRRLDGTTVESITVNAFSVLPDHLRSIVIGPLRGLPAGKYLAVPVLDVGADFLVGGQGPVEIP